MKSHSADLGAMYVSFIKEHGPDSIIVPLFVDGLIEMRDCNYEETHTRIRKAIYDHIVIYGQQPSKEKILEIAAQV